MANRLRMAEVQAILSLFGRGWSRRRIARELGVDPETVNRYVRAHQAQAASQGRPEGCGPSPAKVPTGSAAPLEAPAPPVVRRQSDCLPFADLIQAKLDQGLSARRIHQDLVAEAGFAKSYYSVLR